MSKTCLTAKDTDLSSDRKSVTILVSGQVSVAVMIYTCIMEVLPLIYAKTISVMNEDLKGFLRQMTGQYLNLTTAISSQVLSNLSIILPSETTQS
jgi:hypothetical protein